MTRSLAILVACLICLGVLGAHPTAAQSPSAACLVAPGRSIGAVSIGMDRDAVTRRWGQPDREEDGEDDDGLWMMFELMLLGAVRLSPEGTVDVVGVGDDRCLRTPEGLATGHPRSKVRAIYGAPSEVSEERLSDIVAKKKVRLWIGSAVRDTYVDIYPDRGLAIMTGQTMHVNGYTRDGSPILVPIEPEPVVDMFFVLAPPRHSAMALGR
jgi:hypothetical protein